MADSICSATARFVTKRGVYDGISTKSGVGGGFMCVEFSESLLRVIGYANFGLQFRRRCIGYERVTCFVVLLEDWKVAWP